MVGMVVNGIMVLESCLVPVRDPTEFLQSHLQQIKSLKTNDWQDTLLCQ